MATKYTRPDSTDDASRGPTRRTGSDVRFPRFSTAPPSRRALSWIIIGIASIVMLLMIVSELPALDFRSTANEYVWQHGTVIANESSEGQRILRVEIPADGDQPSHIYDISLDGHGDWAAIAEHDAVRIQALLDGAGNIKRIIRVEPVEESVAIEERPAKESATE